MPCSNTTFHQTQFSFIPKSVEQNMPEINWPGLGLPGLVFFKMNFKGMSPLSQDDARDTTSFMISFKLHKHPSAPEPWNSGWERL